MKPSKPQQKTPNLAQETLSKFSGAGQALTNFFSPKKDFEAIEEEAWVDPVPLVRSGRQEIRKTFKFLPVNYGATDGKPVYGDPAINSLKK